MLHNQHSSVNSQLDRLERISNQISLLISNNDYERISHLDRMRKKIITDMQEKNLELSTNHKKSESERMRARSATKHTNKDCVRE